MNKIKVAVFFACLAFTSHALACSELIYPSHLGPGTLKTYDTIAVVLIQKITPTATKGWYAPPFKFVGKVIQNIKGTYAAGDSISGETGGDQMGAGCPIDLRETSTYLLFFHKTQNPVTLARYGSYFREVSDPARDPYVKDLEALLAKK